MPKRKRSHAELHEPAIDPNDPTESIRRQKQLSKSTLDQYEKTLFRALRLARGFERQKLGRRQKVAKKAKDDAETARLNTEVAALKVCQVKQRPVRGSLLMISFTESRPLICPASPNYIFISQCLKPNE